MNKSIITLCAILALATSSLNAQTNTSTTTRYGNTLNLGVGIGGYGGYYSYYGSAIPVLYADYEFDVAKNFTLAPFISFHTHSRRHYWGSRDYYYRQTVIPIGVKGTYYFDDIVRASPKWDFYVAGSLGFAIVRSRWDDGYDGDRRYYRNPNPLFLNIHLGVEYHINSKVGAFLDFSSGVSTIGIAIH